MTRLRKRVERKTHPLKVAALVAMRKQPAWIGFAHRISGPTKSLRTITMSALDREVKEGDTVVIAGKVVGVGSLTKRVRLVALGYSASARVKVKETKSEIVSLLEEIKKNPKAQGVKFIL